MADTSHPRAYAQSGLQALSGWPPFVGLGVATYAVPVLCACCAKSSLFLDPFFPDGDGDCGSHCCVTKHRTTQILTQSKTSDNELKQTMFHTKNARLPSLGGFQGGHRKANLRLGAMRALAGTPPCAHQA